jgi:hypothetical protein
MVRPPLTAGGTSLTTFQRNAARDRRLAESTGTPLASATKSAPTPTIPWPEPGSAAAPSDDVMVCGNLGPRSERETRR